MNLSPIQEEIVNTPGNLIVRASAGTGKTHTMVSKIAKEINENHTHKVIAAITFTIKAAQEIVEKSVVCRLFLQAKYFKNLINFFNTIWQAVQTLSGKKHIIIIRIFHRICKFGCLYIFRTLINKYNAVRDVIQLIFPVYID